MKKRFDLGRIPAIIWGEPSDKIYIFVHGKMSSKEAAERFAFIAEQKGYQTLSFDLPQHGERKDDTTLDVFSGILDLRTVADYVYSRWNRVSLYACSLGAYFSLQTYVEQQFDKVLFQSPIVDMAYLVDRMMEWFNVNPKQLEAQGIIETPIDPLRWDYYQYILAHPVENWPFHTGILYGGRDNMQSHEVMQSFARRFHCQLTVSEDSEHPFMSEKDAIIVEKWLQENI